MPNLIYRNPPEGPGDKPKLRQAAERPAQSPESQSESPESLLQQLKLLQDEYTRAQSRADQLERKISETQTLIANLGKDSEAGKILAQAIEKLKSTKDTIKNSAYLKAIDEAIHETETKIYSNYEQVLLREGAFIPTHGDKPRKIAELLFHWEKDPHKMVQLCHKFQSLMGSYFTIYELGKPLKIYGGVEPILKMITELEGLKLSTRDIATFCLLPTKLNISKVKATISAFRKNGITENFAACYIISTGQYLYPAHIAPFIKKLSAAKIDPIYWNEIFEVCKGNLPDIDRFLKSMSLHQSALAKAGLEEQEIIDFVLTTGLNDNELAQVPKLMGAGFSFEEAQVLAQENCTSQEIASLQKLVNNGIKSDYAISWLKVEKNPDKIIAYVARCKSFPAITVPYFALYPIISDPNDLTQDLVKKAAELANETQITQREAFYALYMEKYPASVAQGPDVSPFKSSWPMLKSLGIPPSRALLVWALARTYDDSPSQDKLRDTATFLEAWQKETGANIGTLSSFIIECQKINQPLIFSGNDIVSLWAYNWQMPVSQIGPVLTHLETHKFPFPQSWSCAWALYKTTVGRHERIPLALHALDSAIRFDNENMETFFSDPAMPYCEALIKIGIQPRDALIYGRNLWFARIPLKTVAAMKKEDLAKERARIETAQKNFEHLSLFRGRNVVCLKEMDLLDGKDRFMTEEMQLAIMTSIGIENPAAKLNVYSTGKLGDSQKEREAVGKKFPKAIVESKPPTTFIAECHGSPNGFSQFGISTKDLANAFKKRAEKWKSTPLKDKLAEDIVVSKSCFFHTAARAVMDSLRSSDTTPIFIAGNEYGSFGFTAAGRENFIFKGLHAGDPDPQIRDVILSEGQYRASDISIYTRDISNKQPVQVTQTDKDKGKST